MNVESFYPDPKKVATMEGFSIPKFVTDVKAFL